MMLLNKGFGTVKAPDRSKNNMDAAKGTTQTTAPSSNMFQIELVEGIFPNVHFGALLQQLLQPTVAANQKLELVAAVIMQKHLLLSTRS